MLGAEDNTSKDGTGAVLGEFVVSMTPEEEGATGSAEDVSGKELRVTTSVVLTDGNGSEGCDEGSCVVVDHTVVGCSEVAGYSGLDAIGVMGTKVSGSEVELAADDEPANDQAIDELPYPDPLGDV